jgi:predicted RNA-binding protein with PIN domain
VPYLIDGNNLLGSWGGRSASGSDRRAEVVRRVAAFCRTRGAHAVIVFDGKPLRDGQPAQELGPVVVRVPPPGQDADSVIRGLVDSARQPRDLIVVTSDKALYSYARTRGARILRAHEWNALERAPKERPDKRRAPAATDEKPEREDDIDGWLKRFENR